ncbi:hypothetical protein [Kitasatospora sp. McL0602]|uniref:hypothetical protein n=1 Tax=Kitasatospora sp. McL0602 TaxID=3439530 RepID=UPI003F8B3738
MGNRKRVRGLARRSSPPKAEEFAFRLTGIHVDPQFSRTQKQAAWRRLIRRDPRFQDLQQAVKVGRGAQRTTLLWANTAQAISAIFGPCWPSSPAEP